MAKRVVLSRLEFEPATAERWPDVVQLFGERGACGGCWCMAWRLGNKEWEAGKGARNKRALAKIIRSGDTPGVLAYFDGRPIGWCAIAPREAYPRLERSRVLKVIDDREVWSITCLFVLRPYRRQGVSVRLLKAAVAFARTRRARIVEGYPVEPYSDKIPDAFAWTGIPSAFERAGFKEVMRRSRTRPIMRYALR